MRTKLIVNIKIIKIIIRIIKNYVNPTEASIKIVA